MSSKDREWFGKHMVTGGAMPNEFRTIYAVGKVKGGDGIEIAIQTYTDDWVDMPSIPVTPNTRMDLIPMLFLTRYSWFTIKNIGNHVKNMF